MEVETLSWNDCWEPLPLTDCWLSDMDMMSSKEEEEASGRRVSFNENNNRIVFLENTVLDPETKQSLWYSRSDYQYFRATLWATSQALLLSAPQDVGDAWKTTLTATYERKSTGQQPQQQQPLQQPRQRQPLSQVYTQAHDLVGLEYYVINESCQADARARKSAINGALRLTKRTSGATSCKARHLSVLSRRLSRTPQRFAHEIASAQWEALAWS
mmetsp:Transcript_22655/g.63008  ORF Transcript_22655/g.63008 Transcript_22655/m.63008 type:complete len:215 (-) Transcript_22655:23-667(-)